MNFEELQKTWQTQNRGPRLTLGADLLLKEVEHNRKYFVRSIFWRDVREVGAAAILALWSIRCGIKNHDWLSFLMALACLSVVAFMLADRWMQRKKRPAISDPLRACVEVSLGQVNHQIWLLKNVVWWYLLPLGLGLEITFGYSAWRFRSLGLSSVFMSVAMGLGCVLLYWGIYLLNQYAVRKGLEPRRQELEALLASINQ